MKSKAPGSFTPAPSGMETDRSHWKPAPSKTAIGVTRPRELRTSVRLACLMRNEGDTEGARELLTPIYTWFTEGNDTPDLTEAKRLMDELS